MPDEGDKHKKGEPTMTMKELSAFLKEHAVPEKLYKIGKGHNKRICLVKGENDWEVYFQEKKQKIGLLRYNDEESACQGMKNELRKLMESMYGLTWARMTL